MMPLRLFAIAIPRFPLRALLSAMPMCRLAAESAGSVTVLLALLIPGMVIALGLGIEVARWSGAQVSTQRGADIAAAAGAAVFNQTNNAQAAATAAARLAQYNGASGATTPTWNSSTKTLTSGNITSQVGSGLSDSSNTAVRVTIVQTLPLWFSGLVSDLAQ